MTILPSEPFEPNNAAVTPIAIASMIGILHYTKNKSKAQQQGFFDWIDNGHWLHLKVYDFMNNIIDECDQSDVTLTNNKSDLWLSIENESFGQMNVKAIRKSCQELLTTFESLSEDNGKRKKQARKYLRDIAKIKVDFENSKRNNCLAYMAKGLLGGGGGGGVFGLTSTANGTTKSAFLSGLYVAAAGALVGAGFTKLADFCTSYDNKALLIILNKLTDDMLYLQNYLSESNNHIDSVIQLLKNYVSSADINIKYSSQLGH